ncbi:MAG: glutaminase domain-containing protein [Tepidisphaerales bacterium]
MNTPRHQTFAPQSGITSRIRPLAFLSLLLTSLIPGLASAQDVLRAPAVPLVAVDPYFSIWSPADKLTDADTMHWTGAPNRLTSLVRIDGKTFRVMGKEPADLPALEQKGLRILPTTVTYTFEGAGVRLDLSFMTPLLPEDLMIFSRPVTYVDWSVKTIDAAQHDVQVYYDNTAELVVHDPRTEKVTWATEKFGDIAALKVGSAEQPVLRRKGDGVRINWGYQYVAVPAAQDGKLLIAAPDVARQAWGKETPDAAATPMPAAAAPVLSATFNLGKVGQQPTSRWLMLAYDDIYSAQFFKKDLKAYWKKDGAEIGDLLKKSAADYAALRTRCAKFEEELMADLEKSGGPKYAWICALAYRQSCAASKVVADGNGQPLYFCKENTSNGCMGTVDVFYPQAPLPLLISPSLSKAMLIPVLEYASTPAWTWPNAPHDVGTWPQANGQVYGGTKSNGGMPVEETGNMLLLVAAVAQVEGNADFAGKYWPVLTKWAQYLEQFGRDPENQLCTDDFAGHLAHNANLAGKAICALGAYGKLAGMRGDQATADKYLKMAREYALGWIKQADDGDHFRLAFDRPNTWSSKYNLVWDKILDLKVFPDDAIKKEMAFYRKTLDTYGLPLDGRKQNAPGNRKACWTKTDWAFWTACLTDNREDFDAITAPVYRFYAEATRRVGLTDLYFTDKPDAALMHSRPVIGGLFIKMLYNQPVWKKWASRDQTKANGPWAPIPTPAAAIDVVKPASLTWRYTTQKPAADWVGAAFDDAAWKQGRGGFGTRGTPGAIVNTVWNTDDIWLRGEITIPDGKYHDLQLNLHHDEDAEIYINGQLAVKVSGFITAYEPVPVGGGITLKPGKFPFAIHCHQTEGGQYIDVGIVDIQPGK